MTPSTAKPARDKEEFALAAGFSHYADEFLKWAIVAAVFLLPLIISPAGFDVFDLTKATTLYLLTILMLLVWLSRVIILQHIRRHRTFLDLPVVFFGLTVILATAFSSNPLMSIIGEYGRYETLQVLLAYVFIFFLASEYFDDRRWVERLILALFVSALFISIYGIRQEFDWEWLADFLKRPEARSRSTLGNAVFFGGFLAMVIPLFVFKFFDNGKEAFKGLSGQRLYHAGLYLALFYFAVCGLIWANTIEMAIASLVAFAIIIWMSLAVVSRQFAGVVFSLILFQVGLAGTVFAESRGAWLATFIALAYLIAGWILIYYLNSKERDLSAAGKLGLTLLKGMLIMIMAGAIAAFITGYWGARGSPAKRAEELAGRLRSSFVLSGGTTATRFEIWKGCIKMIHDRPLLGFGPDQMLDWFPRYRTLRYTRLEGEMTMPDRVHNELIQNGVNLGIPGFLGYLWVLSALALAIYRHLRDNYDPLVLGLSAGLLGSFIQSLFSIAIIGNTSVFWILIATLAALVARQKIRGKEKILAFSLKKEIPYAIKTVLICLLLVAAIFVGRLATIPQEADVYYYYGNYASRSSAMPTQMLGWFEKAFRTYPYRSIYRQTIISVYSERARIANDPKGLKEAIAIAEEGLKINPRDEDLTLRLVDCYGYLASVFDPKAETLVEQTLLRTIEIDPLFSYPRLRLNEIYLNKGNFGAVVENTQRILELQPNSQEALYQMAFAYENLGNREIAHHYYSRLFKLSPDYPGVRDGLERTR